MRRPPSSPSPARGALLWLGALALSCGPAGRGEAGPVEPPLPGNLGELDPRVAARIDAARARVLAEPGSGPAWAELGLIYAAERLRNLALDCLAEARARDPAEPRWPYHEACTLAALGRVEPAAEAIERSLELEPGYAPSWWRLGSYRLELGDLERARQAFVRATELDPDHPGGWFGLARVHLQEDRPEQALELLERLRARDPDDRIVQRLLADALRQAGRPAALDLAAAVEDEEAPAWNDPWEAQARAHREDPTLLRAGQLLQRGRAREALALLEQARGSQSEPNLLALQVAEARLQLGELDQAEREVRALLAEEPESSSAHMLLARIFERRGEHDRSIAELETVTRLQPRYGGACAALGGLLYRRAQGDPQMFARACTALEQAIEYGVGDAEVRFTLGQAQLALSRWEAARATFEALLAESPSHGDAWSGLARARLKLGDLEGAAAALARAEQVGVNQKGYLRQVKETLDKARARREKKAAGKEQSPQEEG